MFDLITQKLKYQAESLRASSGSLILRVLALVLSYAVSIVLARALGVQAFGQFSAIFAVVAILTALSQVGLPSLVIRETMRAKVRAQWEEMSALWRWAATATVSVASAVSGAVIMFAWIGGFDSWAFVPVMIGAASIPIVAASNVAGAAMLGLGRPVYGQIQEFVIRPAITVTAILGVLVITGAFTPATAMACYLAASVVGLILAVLILVRLKPSQLTRSVQPAFAGRSTWIRAAIPLAATVVLQMISVHIGVLIVEAMLTHEDTGVYRAVFQIGQLVSLGTLATDAAFAPAIARAAASGDALTLGRDARRTGIYSVAIGLLVLTALIFLGPALIGLTFGAIYVAAAGSMIVIGAGYLLAALFGSCNIILVMTGNERSTVLPAAAGVVAYGLIATLLIPYLGLLGAAIGCACGLFVWNAALFATVYIRFNINSSILPLPPRTGGGTVRPD
jgi:O-antigen/teichoic acid export membrane protein